MGTESVQIRKHIDEERARLDFNIAKLERDFDSAKRIVTSCWNSPLTLVGIAIVVGLALGAPGRRYRSEPEQSSTSTVSDIAA
jgi:hypothetical protein